MIKFFLEILRKNLNNQKSELEVQKIKQRLIISHHQVKQCADIQVNWCRKVTFSTASKCPLPSDHASVGGLIYYYGRICFAVMDLLYYKQV